MLVIIRDTDISLLDFLVCGTALRKLNYMFKVVDNKKRNNR